MPFSRLSLVFCCVDGATSRFVLWLGCSVIYASNLWVFGPDEGSDNSPANSSTQKAACQVSSCSICAERSTWRIGGFPDNLHFVSPNDPAFSRSPSKHFEVWTGRDLLHKCVELGRFPRVFRCPRPFEMGSRHFPEWIILGTPLASKNDVFCVGLEPTSAKTRFCPSK
jgi:hypothetical protein